MIHCQSPSKYVICMVLLCLPCSTVGEKLDLLAKKSYKPQSSRHNHVEWYSRYMLLNIQWKQMLINTAGKRYIWGEQVQHPLCFTCFHKKKKKKEKNTKLPSKYQKASQIPNFPPMVQPIYFNQIPCVHENFYLYSVFALEMYRYICAFLSGNASYFKVY